MFCIAITARKQFPRESLKGGEIRIIRIEHQLDPQTGLRISCESIDAPLMDDPLRATFSFLGLFLDAAATVADLLGEGNVTFRKADQIANLNDIAGGPLCWRVGVGGRWGAPGQRLAAPPGPTVVTLVLEVVTAGLWLLATTRFQVAVAPGGTTLVALPGSAGHRSQSC